MDTERKTATVVLLIAGVIAIGAMWAVSLFSPSARLAVGVGIVVWLLTVTALSIGIGKSRADDYAENMARKLR